MNTLEITRELEKHVANWQVTADGEFDFYATRELTLGGQPVRVEVERMVEEFRDGRLSAIHTHYVMYALDNEGNKIDPSGNNATYCRRLSMTANTRDRKDFARAYAPSLVYSMWNGYFRSALGYNYTPPFNSATGQALSYTPEQEAASPTWDYFTHHSDGTPISLVTEEPAA